MYQFNNKSIYLKTPIEILKFKNEQDFKSYINDLDEDLLNEFNLDLGRSNSNKKTFVSKNYTDEIKDELIKKKGLLVIFIAISLLVYGFFNFKSLKDFNFLGVINALIILIGIYFTSFSVALIKSKLLKVPKKFILDSNIIIVKGLLNLTLLKFYPKSISLHSLSRKGSVIMKFSDRKNRVIITIPMVEDVHASINYYNEFYMDNSVQFQE